jgi:hypothetical protein
MNKMDIGSQLKDHHKTLTLNDKNTAIFLLQKSIKSKINMILAKNITRVKNKSLINTLLIHIKK